MKRFLIILIPLLFLSLIVSYSVFADENSGKSDMNSSELSELEGTDIQESDEEETSESDQKNENEEENHDGDSSEEESQSDQNDQTEEEDPQEEPQEEDKEQIEEDKENQEEQGESEQEDSEITEGESEEELNADEEETLMMRSVIDESETSRLGHLRKNVKIYKKLGDNSSAIDGNKYTDAVYYIKKQAQVKGQLHYLISTSPSSKNGVVGWVKSQDMSTHSHVGQDKKSKTFYFKGSGKAYTKAWGGSKDLVHKNMSKYKDEQFKVHLTEKVGNNTWYRGTFKGETIWLHSSYVTTAKENKTSRLGHLRKNVKIYKKLGDNSSAIDGNKYTDAVYYIKKQAQVKGQIHYLISTSPSSKNGVVGWVKSQDMSTHSHVGQDKKSKTFYFKGSGKAYTKAWGGSKDLVHKNMSKYKGEKFKVHLTEKVGNNTWYRGTFKGETIWLHSSYVTTAKENKTSRLGHLRKNVKIYKKLGDNSSAIDGNKYTDAVYYIKKQTKVNDQIYYLISTSPSSKNGVVGWVKSQDMSTHPHVGVDKKIRTLYFAGDGNAYTKAWGGSKDLVHKNMSKYKGEQFKVHLTEKVGNNTWYRGNFKGKTIWLHESYLKKKPLKEVTDTHTNYNLTLNQMANIQMNAGPKTDKRYSLWIREDAFGSISKGQGIVKGSNWNLRRGPGTNYLADGQVSKGTKLTLHSSKKGADGFIWYHVDNTSGWVTPDREDLIYNLNPKHFLNDMRGKLQFLKLSESSNLADRVLNKKILFNKGSLTGKAAAFSKGAKDNQINEIYLISHALLETGNGKSELATGVKHKGKTVYNMYGIGANDSCALECGKKYAYNAGWFTPEKAIIGGAEFVGKSYLSVGQDTLYKMRWNPAFAEREGKASHQYATDIGWARKQTAKMNEMYDLLDGYHMVFDIPKYK